MNRLEPVPRPRTLQHSSGFAAAQETFVPGVVNSNKDNGHVLIGEVLNMGKNACFAVFQGSC